MPRRRLEADAVFDEATSEVVLFGGLAYSDSSGQEEWQNDTWTWDGTSWTRRLGAGPPALAYASIGYDEASGSVILFGGATCNGTTCTLTAATWIWDGSHWAPAPTSPAPPARLGASIATDPVTGHVVLFGGCTRLPIEQENCLTVVNDMWEWNGHAWRQLHPRSVPTARAVGSMAAAPGGELVLYGGIGPATLQDDANVESPSPLTDTWTWDGTTWTERRGGPSPSGRYSPAMVYDPQSGGTLLVGGAAPGGQFVDDVWIWDGFAWAKTNPAGGPPPFANGALAHDTSRGEDVLFGGLRCEPSFTSCAGTTLRDTWLMRDLTWSRIADPTPEDRYNAGMAYDEGRQQDVLYGGSCLQDSADTSLDCGRETWVWDGHAWSVEAIGAGPRPQPEATLVYDAKTDTVVDYALEDTEHAATWTWDGSTWTRIDNSGMPGLREGPAMAMDRTGSLVLFGGLKCSQATGCVYNNETWTWNGSSWAIRHPRHAPEPRAWAQMAYDGASRETVLFGGANCVQGDCPAVACLRVSLECMTANLNFFDDTWTWDGNDWTHVQPKHAPRARAYGQLAYDLAPSGVILYGGVGLVAQTNVGVAYSDTWRWDGSDWNSIDANAPTERYDASMAEAPSGGLLLFGGAIGGSTSGNSDTWIFSSR